jgi:hypothetical protein
MQRPINATSNSENLSSVFKENKFSIDVLLNFKDPEVEEGYLRHYFSKGIKTTRIILFIFLLLGILSAIAYWIVPSDFFDNLRLFNRFDFDSVVRFSLILYCGLLFFYGFTHVASTKSAIWQRTALTGFTLFYTICCILVVFYATRWYGQVGDSVTMNFSMSWYTSNSDSNDECNGQTVKEIEMFKHKVDLCVPVDDDSWLQVATCTCEDDTISVDLRIFNDSDCTGTANEFTKQTGCQPDFLNVSNHGLHVSIASCPYCDDRARVLPDATTLCFVLCFFIAFPLLGARFFHVVMGLFLSSTILSIETFLVFQSFLQNEPQAAMVEPNTVFLFTVIILASFIVPSLTSYRLERMSRINYVYHTKYL